MIKSITKKFPKGVEIVVGAVIENSKGQILLTKSPKWHNKWVLPGGHVNPGETILEGSSREIQEEVGVKLKPVIIINFGELINSKDFHRPAHFIYFNIFCITLGNRVKIDNREITDYLWIEPKKSLKMNLTKIHKKFITDYLKYKKSSKK